MATMLSELEVHTQRTFIPIITNQLFLKSPVLYRIFKIAEEGDFGMASPSYDGRQIIEPVEMAETTTGNTAAVGAYSRDDDWEAGEGEVLKGAAYDWKLYHMTIKIHNLDTEMNKGKSRIFDIAAVRLRNGMRSLRKSMAEDLYNTSYTNESTDPAFISLPAFCATANTIGGINKSSNTWWKGITESTEVVTDGGTPTTANVPLNWEILNKFWYKTKKYGDNDPATLIVASEGVLQKYEDEISKANQDNAVRIIANLGGPKEVDGGFRAFFFKGIPMISDTFCPSNEAYFINENYLHWRLLKQFSSTGWQQLETQGKDYAQMTYKGYGALTSSCNKKFARLTDLEE